MKNTPVKAFTIPTLVSFYFQFLSYPSNIEDGIHTQEIGGGTYLN